ncbi:hypothetical protein TIFTF001_040079, partial [Ficus carica]
MRALLVISAALLLAMACLQATGANPKPVDLEGRKPSGRAVAIISGGGRRLLEANVVVSAPKCNDPPSTGRYHTYLH